MPMSAQRTACINAIKAATNGPANQDAAIGAVVDAIIDLIHAADFTSTSLVSATGGPVTGVQVGGLS